MTYPLVEFLQRTIRHEDQRDLGETGVEPQVSLKHQRLRPRKAGGIGRMEQLPYNHAPA